MYKPKILIVINDNFFGGIQLRWDYLKDKFTNIDLEVISRQNLGTMNFKVIDNFGERINYINQFDIVDFQTNGIMTIEELPFCQNKVVETIHSIERSSQITDMKIGMSDCVSLNQILPCQTIYPGVNLERIKKGDKSALRKKWGIPENMVVVGRIGRLVSGKHPFDFCRVAALVKGAYYLMVNEGTKDMQTLSNFMQQNKVTWNYIEGSPEINKDFWSIIDILLYPTEDESYCNVFFEAMFSDIPIVTYAIPVANEFGIQIRCKLGDIQELAIALQNLIDDEKLRKELIIRGQKIRQGHNMLESIPKLERLYRLLYENRTIK